MKLTPLHLEIVLHYATCGEDMKNIDADATNGYAQWLCEQGMLERMNNAAPPGCCPNPRYVTSDKGRVWLDHLLATPFPVQKMMWKVPA